MREASSVLAQRLARAPRVAELAGYLHVSEEQIAEAQLADQAFQAVSLDAPMTGEDGSIRLADLIGEEDPQLQQTIDLDHADVRALTARLAGVR